MSRFFLLLGLFLSVATGLPAAPGGPNVLLIISDDQAWTDYGFMGHPAIETPRLDRLAGESLTYTRGYVAAPLCRPSLASIMLGLHPHQHGITGNDPTLPTKGKRGMAGRKDPAFAGIYETMMHRIEEHPTIAGLLGKRGYLSFQTGKWWEGNHKRGGFTHGMTHGDPTRGGRHGDKGLEISRQGHEPIVEFLDLAKKDDKPFFIWHAPFLPHTPHNPPEELFKKYQAKTDSAHVARYWAMCEWFDRTCGELLDLLDDRGLRENTVVLYVTDNGWIQQPDSKRFAARSKQSPYEGGIRTPIMIRWPGKVEPRRDDATLASAIDLAPTILRACGAPVPESMPGLDLRDTAALGKRNAIFGAAYAHDVADVNEFTRSLNTRYIVHGDWKLLVPNEKNLPGAKVELYNLQSDPHETRNLAAKHPGKVTDLTTRLDAWWPGS
ncbi:MAG: sulfatase-like hydrolase/transferase [Akkermansiaceae bacterium]|nr:sulfatase-like hydrolase/transferase [Akkermansiaceae bacterium]